MERSRYWPDLWSSTYKIRDIQVVGFHELITSCKFESARSSTLALTRPQSCKMVMWGRVNQTDLMTWPFKLGSYNLHCKKDEGIVMPNSASLRAAVFPLSTKKLREGGGGYPHPSVCGLNVKASSLVITGYFMSTVVGKHSCPLNLHNIFLYWMHSRRFTNTKPKIMHNTSQ